MNSHFERFQPKAKSPATDKTDTNMLLKRRYCCWLDYLQQQHQQSTFGIFNFLIQSDANEWHRSQVKIRITMEDSKIFMISKSRFAILLKAKLAIVRVSRRNLCHTCFSRLIYPPNNLCDDFVFLGNREKKSTNLMWRSVNDLPRLIISRFLSYSIYGIVWFFFSFCLSSSRSH